MIGVVFFVGLFLLGFVSMFGLENSITLLLLGVFIRVLDFIFGDD